MFMPQVLAKKFDVGVKMAGGGTWLSSSLNCFVNALGTKVWSSRHHSDARGN
jgi:hypothetical protein